MRRYTLDARRTSEGSSDEGEQGNPHLSQVNLRIDINQLTDAIDPEAMTWFGGG